jgi:hypothetical protein
MRSRKKLYYIPGTISLISLPLLFYFYNIQYHEELVQTAIPIIVWNKNWTEKFPNLFSGNYPPKRNYQDIYLTGDDKTDNIKLAFSELRVREIIQQNDGANGVHYYFGEATTYASFIKVLDILRTEKAKKYMIYDNDIWLLHDPPEPVSKTIQGFICGTTYSSAKMNEPERSHWLTFKKHFKDAGESSWQIFIAFMVLFGFTIFSVNNQNKDD